MKTFLLSFFALIGAICVVTKIISYYNWNSATSEYYTNCNKVRVGMPLNEARKIIGDLQYNAWTQDDLSGESSFMVRMMRIKNTFWHMICYREVQII